MHRLNHRQCRQARGMLKWNFQDLSRCSKINARRLEAYERGIAKLEGFELRDLVKAFVDHGIHFTSTSVTLNKDAKAGGGSTESRVQHQAEHQVFTPDDSDPYDTDIKDENEDEVQPRSRKPRAGF